MTFKDGKFVIEIDIADFDPDDIEVRVEGDQLVLQGEREVRRGANFTKRFFNQKFALPDNINVDEMTSDVSKDGVLAVSAPALKPVTAEGVDADGTTTITKKGETKTTTSEGEVALEGGGVAKTQSSATESKKSQTTKKESEDGSYEEETVEEFFESSSSSSTSSMSFGGDDAGGQIDFDKFGDFGNFGNMGKDLMSKMEMSMPSLKLDIGSDLASLSQMSSLGGGLGATTSGSGMPTNLGGTTQTSIAKTEETLKAEKGQVVEMSKKESNTSETKQLTIPISMGASSAKPKTPKPRTLPFQFEQQAIESASAAASKCEAKATTEIEESEFFVPLKNIGNVQKSALADASAMAKRKGDFYELVVNIQKFAPEQVKVFVSGQAVIVQAKNVDASGQVNDSYEQRFGLPDDVDVSRLTSGISKDGILMIRVPRAAQDDRYIPIQYNEKISAVEKALAESVKNVEMSATEIKDELAKENIAPIKIEKEEDAVKAASAEVIEALTVGVAEAAGAEAGDEAGAKSAIESGQVAVEAAIAKAVAETAREVGMEIAGQLGAKVAEQVAVQVGMEAGRQAAAVTASRVGGEVGRIAGAQAASIAAAEELAKMNVAEITEEKARAMKATFEEIGKKAGSVAGETAGKEGGKSVNADEAVAEAVEATREAAKKAAAKAKELLDLAKEVATADGAAEGEEGGREGGADEGEKAAAEAIVKAAKEAAANAMKAVLGDKCGENAGAELC